MPCSRQPLSTTTALSFSGVSTRLIGKLPRSAASPAGSSRTPVGSGEVKSGFLWADTNVHSSAESERASRQIRSENITGVPHRLGTTNDILRMFRRPSGWSLHIVPNRPIARCHVSLIGKKLDEDGCRANHGHRTTELLPCTP